MIIKRQEKGCVLTLFSNGSTLCTAVPGSPHRSGGGGGGPPVSILILRFSNKTNPAALFRAECLDSAAVIIVI